MKEIWKRKAILIILTLIAQARLIILPLAFLEMSNVKKPKDVLTLGPFPGTERCKGSHICVASGCYIHSLELAPRRSFVIRY